MNLFEPCRGYCGSAKAAIAMAAMICACAAVAIGKSLSPRYSASAELYVDPRELQLVDRELTPRAQDVSGLSMVGGKLQARLITSNSVLVRVIREQNLEQGPGVRRRSPNGIVASLLGLVRARGCTLPAQKSQARGRPSALDALNRHISD